MPKLHPLQYEVFVTEERISELYKSDNLEAIETLSKKASALRVDFAIVKTDCRDQV